MIHRLAIAALSALVAAAFVYAFELRHPEVPSDYEQLWLGARALIAGLDPYEVVGPGRSSPYPFRLYYPLPAVLIAVPFAPFPLAIARAMWAAVSAFALTLALMRNGWGGLYALGSGAYLQALQLGQFAPLLAAATAYPWLGAVGACKPNVAVGVVAAAVTRRQAVIVVGSAVAFLAASLLAFPRWPIGWLEAVRSADHFMPLVLMPGGFVLLLALLRWRLPEARALIALACVPGTPSVHEALIFMAIPQSRLVILAMALLTHIPRFGQALFLNSPDFSTYSYRTGLLVLWCVYVPMLAILLKTRPGRAGPAGEPVA